MSELKWQAAKELFHEVVDLSPTERQIFLSQKCDDPQLRREVEDLLLNYEESEDFIERSAVVEAGIFDREPSKVGSRIGHFEILREIGRGGMGTVYLASRSDQEFDQQVALKIVKRGMDTDFIVQRFRHERQILATLNHPNIAKLFEGGTTDDGLPYFVMEFIEGQDLITYCDDNDLDLETRLELFRQVCSAVSYAHQNLVVHRDLKPSNILVRADGLPKLLDFGIAKILNPEGDTGNTKTTGIFRLLTPEYASPEQIRGEKITTTSDVYSLGVILYEMLTGASPYHTKSNRYEEIVDSVCKIEPIVPSSALSKWSVVRETGKAQKTTLDDPATNPRSKLHNPKSLRGDLDNIVIKALKKEPERRYQSVQEFSEDIRRHLTGLPVLAQPDTFGYRTAKFIKRNRVGVLAGLLVLLSLVTGIAATSWQAYRANAEKAKAEQRFQDVRKLANSIVFEFHDSIQNLPGSTPTRELLVGRALEYLDKLAVEAESDQSLQLELAEAYDKIGDIQGGLATSQMGQREKAVESYQKSLRIREKLMLIDPDNINFRSKLATSYSKMGDMRWIELNLESSLEMYRKSFEILSKLAGEMPHDDEIKNKVAVSQISLSRALAVTGKTEESLVHAKQAITLLEYLTGRNPEAENYLHALTAAYDRLAEIYKQVTANYPESVEYYRKSQIISEKLLLKDPQNTKLRRGVAVSFFNLAEILTKIGEDQAALENAQKSLEAFSQLQAEDPKNEEFTQIVAAAETQVSGLLVKVGQPAGAITRLEKSLEILNRQKAESPNDEIINFRIATVYEHLGRASMALTADKKLSKPQILANWSKAHTQLQKSYAIYKVFYDAGKLVGEDAKTVEMVKSDLEKCERAIKEFH